MKNHLKSLLADRTPAIGSWVGLSDPYSVEMMADMGFDWLLIDMEHFPMSKETLRTILMACKGSASTPIVRVPLNSVDYIQAALDLGAQGVMAPMIDSAEDARRAVGFSRYPPLGRRGMGPIRASRYLNDLQEYREKANIETALFVQIETPESAKLAREIMANPGIDGLFIGNGDLANFMNQGQLGSKAVQSVVNELIELAGALSMPVGLPAWTEDELADYVKRGACLLTVGSDLGFLAQGARSELSKVRRQLTATKRP